MIAFFPMNSSIQTLGMDLVHLVSENEKQSEWITDKKRELIKMAISDIIPAVISAFFLVIWASTALGGNKKV